MINLKTEMPIEAKQLFEISIKLSDLMPLLFLNSKM